MKSMTGTAYREVRRLRLLRLSCDVVVAARSLQTELASKRLLAASRSIEGHLAKYYRSTGRIRTEEIAENYLDTAADLGLLRVKEGVFEPMSLGVALAAAEAPSGLALSLEEKLLFFETIVASQPTAGNVWKLIATLSDGKNRTPMKLAADAQVPERVVKSHTEWLIDLKCVGATRQSRGAFYLSEKGKSLAELLQRENPPSPKDLVLRFAAEEAKGLHPSLPPLQVVENAVRLAAKRLKELAHSQIDPNLLAAEPVLLLARIIMLASDGYYAERDWLLKTIEAAAPRWRMVFSWDPAYNSGYIRLS